MLSWIPHRASSIALPYLNLAPLRDRSPKGARTRSTRQFVASPLAPYRGLMSKQVFIEGKLLHLLGKLNEIIRMF